MGSATWDPAPVGFLQRARGRHAGDRRDAGGPCPAAADASADVWVDEQNDFIGYWSGSEDGDITLSYTPLREGPNGTQRFTLTIDGSVQVWIDPESPRCRHPDPSDGTRAKCTLSDVTTLPTVHIELDGGGPGRDELFGGSGTNRVLQD